jgi:DNA-binding MarR family transcriptional regulator
MTAAQNDSAATGATLNGLAAGDAAADGAAAGGGVTDDGMVEGGMADDNVAHDGVADGGVTDDGVADAGVADRVWEAMRDLVHDYERQREVVEALGMSLAKVKALRRISTSPMTCKQLAARMLTDAPRASVLIDELVQRGLAVRTVAPDDRRVRIVQLTEFGAAEAARATKILTRAPEAVREMSAQDLADLDRILRRFAGQATVGSA